jgi:hypothetical protein
MDIIPFVLIAIATAVTKPAPAPREFVGSAMAACAGTRASRCRALFAARKKELLAAAVSCVQFVLLRLYQRLREREKGRWWSCYLAQVPSSKTRQEIEGFIRVAARKQDSSDIVRRKRLFDPQDVGEFDEPPPSVVVARNYAKGYQYYVCLQSKSAMVLNEIEHVVAVLLHEVAHSIHHEYERSEVHGADFQVINSFLVRVAREELATSSAQERAAWRAPDSTKWQLQGDLGRRDFLPAKFASACRGGSEQPNVSFCGLSVPIGTCNGGCGGGAPKKSGTDSSLAAV